MTTPGIPEDIDQISPITPKPTTAGAPKTATRPFQSYMEGAQPNPLTQAGTPNQVTPFDLAQGKVPASGPTLQTIHQQTVQAQQTMGDISNTINNNPKLKLKQSSKYLLKNKLTSAQAHILSASDKLGAPKIPSQGPQGKGPLSKFLGLLTDGQTQLDATQQHLAGLAAKGGEMNPADMLLIQIKLSKAQQELEYSSLLLSKAVDDLKMMMNIQL